jgi:uncharacterized membrane protein
MMKNFDLKTFIRPEFLFATIALIFGSLIVFINPPFHSNDEDRHFLKAYIISTGRILPEKRGNDLGGYLPVNIYSVTQAFQGVNYEGGDRISRNLIDLKKDILIDEGRQDFYHDYMWPYSPVPYSAHILGIETAKIISPKPISLLYFGRFAGLLAYIIIGFFAIKYIPFLKNATMAFALTPMVLYQASSITYDMLINAVSFLLLAMFMNFAFLKSKLTTKDILILMAICLLHRFAKDGYIFLPLLILLIPVEKFGEGKKGWFVFLGLLVFMVLLFFVSKLTWGNMIRSLDIDFASLPKMKKDFLQNSSLNLKFMSEQPLLAVSNLFTSIMHFKNEWIGGIIGRFGYSYTLFPDIVIVLHSIFLIIVFSIDSLKEFTISLKQRFVFIGVGLISMLAVITALYLDSPIGATLVFGFQGRYLIPAVPILLAGLTLNKPESLLWKKWGTLIVTFYSIILLFYTIIFLNDMLYMD